MKDKSNLPAPVMREILCVLRRMQDDEATLHKVLAFLLGLDSPQR